MHQRWWRELTGVEEMQEGTRDAAGDGGIRLQIRH